MDPKATASTSNYQEWQYKDPQRIHDYFDRYTFLCEMYNDHADKFIELVMNFFPFDNSVQITDPRNGKILLRRVQIPRITVPMLQIGNIVNVFAKLLYIKDCVPLTRRTLFYNVVSTFALIKPVPASQHGKILTFITNNGFRIVRMKNGKLTKDLAMEIYRDIGGNAMLPIIIEYVTSGDVIGLELVAEDAVNRWRRVLGNTDPAEAEPGTLRALYGENALRNVAHGCKTHKDSLELCEHFFGYINGLPRLPFRATYKNCTCCIIKPHAIIDGNLGLIIEMISNSDRFYVSALAMFSIKLTDAREFYELYKGVLPEYEQMSIHLAEGKSIVLEVKCRDPSMNVVKEFRKICGPRDPDVCRQLYPDSIRARYGKNIIHNAVHCTDLEEEGEAEVEYFFKLLGNEKSNE